MDTPLHSFLLWINRVGSVSCRPHVCPSCFEGLRGGGSHLHVLLLFFGSDEDPDSLLGRISSNWVSSLGSFSCRFPSSPTFLGWFPRHSQSSVWQRSLLPLPLVLHLFSLQTWNDGALPPLAPRKKTPIVYLSGHPIVSACNPTQSPLS